MSQMLKKTAIATASIITALLAGCTTVRSQVGELQTSASRTIEEEQAKAELPAQVVTATAGAWLLGQPVEVMPTPSPILAQIVTYSPSQRVGLTDVAAWVTNNTGLIVDTAEVQQSANGFGLPQGPIASLDTSKPPSGSVPFVPSVSPTMPAALQSFSIGYTGTLSGLLDVAANKAGVWWKFSDGRITFFRTETRTFYIPAINRPTKGSLTISTSSSGSGGGTGGASSSTGGTSSGGSSGGETSTSAYEVDVWKDLAATVQAVAGSAKVVSNASLGSVTVNGTPAQVRQVEEWVKKLSENLSQQVAITVGVYIVKLTKEDSYTWDPSVIFTSKAVGAVLGGAQAPAPVSGLAPFNIAANVIKTATGNAAKYTGSQLAIRALSAIGEVTEKMRRTVVALNGQPQSMQVANQQSYLASSAPSGSAPVGTTPLPPTLTPGTVTTGFTAMFLPQIVNGKIFLTMHLTNSTLVNLGFAGPAGAGIQVPNVDSTVIPQSVMLTPGDSLLLTSFQLNQGKTNRSGIGSPDNSLLGGGVDNSVGKQMIAIVVSAKVL